MVRVDFKEELFDYKMIRNNMPNIDFEDLNLIKKLKGEFFDQEFYHIMKILRYEFPEPIHMLRLRIPDNTVIGFRTILNTFFNIADIKLSFEYISEASIKSQSK